MRAAEKIAVVSEHYLCLPSWRLDYLCASHEFRFCHPQNRVSIALLLSFPSLPRCSVREAAKKRENKRAKYHLSSFLRRSNSLHPTENDSLS